MSSVNVTIETDLTPITQRFSASAISRAQAELTQQVGHDSNVHCRVDTWKTHDSMALANNPEAGTITWDTPYAKYAYSGWGTVDTRQNPQARDHWFEVAKSEHLPEWVKLVERRL